MCNIVLYATAFVRHDCLRKRKSKSVNNHSMQLHSAFHGNWNFIVIEVKTGVYGVNFDIIFKLFPKWPYMALGFESIYRVSCQGNTVVTKCTLYWRGI